MALDNRPDEYFDQLETMPVPQREEFLNRGLARTARHAYRHAPAIREIFDQAGVSPEQLNVMADLEKLPVTRKDDLIARQKAHPPYGGFLAIPPPDVERVFLSPGPVYEPIQHSGIKWFGKSFWAARFRKGDLVVNTFTYHLSPAGILFHEALRDCGATVIPTGTGNTEIQLQTMLDLKVSGFVGTPTFLMTIIRRAEEMGHDFRRDFCLKRAWFTGEMLPPSLRKTLEEEYGIDTYQTYAVTEPGGAIAYECRRKDGMHMTDDYVVEIVDPETGKQLRPGQVGELVVTPIHNPTWGLIRFGTGDLSSYTTKPCHCGRTGHRLNGIFGRSGDAVKVRGMFVVARQAEGVVSGFEQVARYRITVSRRQHRDEIRLQAELKGEATDSASLAEELNRRFQEVCRIKLDGIEFVPPETLPEGQPQIADERTWE